jgi:hypothetical protein
MESSVVRVHSTRSFSQSELNKEMFSDYGCGQTRIEHIFEKSIDSKVKLPFFTHYGDVTDINNLVILFVLYC